VRDQERHIAIDFQADFNEHALGVPSDQLVGSGVSVVGEQDGGLLLVEILDKELGWTVCSKTRGVRYLRWGRARVIWSRRAVAGGHRSRVK